MSLFIAQRLIALEVVLGSNQATLFAVRADRRGVVARRPGGATKEGAVVRFFSHENPLVAQIANRQGRIRVQQAFVESFDDEGRGVARGCEQHNLCLCSRQGYIKEPPLFGEQEAVGFRHGQAEYRVINDS